MVVQMQWIKEEFLRDVREILKAFMYIEVTLRLQ